MNAINNTLIWKIPCHVNNISMIVYSWYRFDQFILGLLFIIENDIDRNVDSGMTMKNKAVSNISLI